MKYTTSLKQYWRFFFAVCAFSLLFGCESRAESKNTNSRIIVASFNVSMEARNYVDESSQADKLQNGTKLLMQHLASGEHPQIKNIAEIIQRTRPDIILLNEFDYIDSPKLGVQAFINNYLNKPQGGAAAIDYPYFYYAQSNTGLPTSFDLDNDGKASNFGADAYGFGLYYGHYAMVLLSKYPIINEEIRTFQNFLWADMPNALKPVIPETNEDFYDAQEWANFRLSSKSHWDIPIDVNGKTLHVLASHPTPPVFDGDEDRNGKRNHDEIRFWLDYISSTGDYIYDDRGLKGDLAPNASFVILGDLNASPDRISDEKHAMIQLLNSPRVNDEQIPASEAGQQNKADNPYAQYHTASWAARVDYVLPSQDIAVSNSAVFWPKPESDLHRLIKDRTSSSDHYLVWRELILK